MSIMMRLIYRTGGLTDEQIGAIYEAAEKMRVGVVLHGDTPSPSRDSFRWAVVGLPWRVLRFGRFLKSLR